MIEISVNDVFKKIDSDARVLIAYVDHVEGFVTFTMLPYSRANWVLSITEFLNRYEKVDVR